MITSIAVLSLLALSSSAQHIHRRDDGDVFETVNKEFLDGLNLVPELPSCWPGQGHLLNVAGVEEKGGAACKKLTDAQIEAGLWAYRSSTDPTKETLNSTEIQQKNYDSSLRTICRILGDPNTLDYVEECAKGHCEDEDDVEAIVGEFEKQTEHIHKYCPILLPLWKKRLDTASGNFTPAITLSSDAMDIVTLFETPTATPSLNITGTATPTPTAADEEDEDDDEKDPKESTPAKTDKDDDSAAMGLNTFNSNVALVVSLGLAFVAYL